MSRGYWGRLLVENCLGSDDEGISPLRVLVGEITTVERLTTSAINQRQTMICVIFHMEGASKSLIRAATLRRRRDPIHATMTCT